ncbi:MAG: fdrA domain protein [bacterium]
MNKINKLFDSELKVINIGLIGFAEELRNRNTEVVHVDWKPPAGGNKKVQNLLGKLNI